MIQRIRPSAGRSELPIGVEIATGTVGGSAGPGSSPLITLMPFSAATLSCGLMMLVGTPRDVDVFDPGGVHRLRHRVLRLAGFEDDRFDLPVEVSCRFPGRPWSSPVQVGKSHCRLTMLMPSGGGSLSGSSPGGIVVGGTSGGPSTNEAPAEDPSLLSVSPPDASLLSPSLDEGSVLDEEELLPPPQAANAIATVSAITAIVMKRRRLHCVPLSPWCRPHAASPSGAYTNKSNDWSIFRGHQFATTIDEGTRSRRVGGQEVSRGGRRRRPSPLRRACRRRASRRSRDRRRRARRSPARRGRSSAERGRKR